MVPLGGGGGRLALVCARELVLKRQDGALDVAVGVAGAAAAAVEAARGGDAAGRGAGRAGVERRGDAGGGGGGGSAQEVAGATAAGVDVGVLRNGGVRLGDGVARHNWRDLFYYVWMVMMVVGCLVLCAVWQGLQTG